MKQPAPSPKAFAKATVGRWWRLTDRPGQHFQILELEGDEVRVGLTSSRGVRHTTLVPLALLLESWQRGVIEAYEPIDPMDVVSGRRPWIGKEARA